MGFLKMGIKTGEEQQKQKIYQRHEGIEKRKSVPTQHSLTWYIALVCLYKL